MLGALSLKWKWRQRQEAAGKPTDSPNLVFGGDVHVVWDKFCRYFDVEPRIVPLQKGKYTIGPEDVEQHIDENTIGVAAVLGTTFTGHRDDITGINDLLIRDPAKRRASTSRSTSTPPAAASSGRSSIRTRSGTSGSSRCARSTSPGTSSASSIPGIGWLIFREKDDLAQDLVFEENYLGKTDATFTLNFSTGSAMVLAQYYNFVRLGLEGYAYIIGIMEKNARYLAEQLSAQGDFELIDPDAEQLPLVAFQLVDGKSYDEFDVAWQLSAERGWMVPAYTLPPERRRREGDAGAGQGDAEPGADRPPRRPTSRMPARPSRRRAA